MRCEVVCTEQPPALFEVRFQRFAHEVGFMHAPVASPAFHPGTVEPIKQRRWQPERGLINRILGRLGPNFRGCRTRGGLSAFFPTFHRI